MSDQTEPRAHEIDSGVVADRLDQRDAVFSASLTGPLPASVEFDQYKELADTSWHQRGQECTGFALAAVANYSLRKKMNDPALPSVSRRMLYEMAQEHDGKNFIEGSTLRGALKGWSRVGTSDDAVWPYQPGDEDGVVHGKLTLARVLDGRKRPLLRYQRVVDERIDTMQYALAEGRAVYVAARTHVGWYRLFLHDSGTTIERRAGDKASETSHAFVIVGYNEQGFWIHNSWGPEWGDEGYALLPYDQWSWGAVDTWVVDAGIAAAPEPEAATADPKAQAKTERSYREMWPHLIVLGDDGQLVTKGLYEMDRGSVETMLYLFDEHTKTAGWTDRKLAVIATGGEFSAAATIEQLRPLRDKLLAAHVYPIFIVWETEWFDQLAHELKTWRNYRIGGADPSALDTRIAAAESRARAAWNEIGARAQRALTPATTTTPAGGAHLLVESIVYKRKQGFFDLHVVSLGTGDLLGSHLVTMLPTPITGALTIAPTTTLDQFHATYGDMLACGCLSQQTVVTCSASDDADPSVLELVSAVWALPGSTMRQAGRDARQSGTWGPSEVPVLGLARYLDHDGTINALRSRDLLQTLTDDSSYVDLVGTSQMHDLIVDEILTERTPAPLAPINVALTLPLDPLAAAAYLHRSQQAIGPAR